MTLVFIVLSTYLGHTYMEDQAKLVSKNLFHLKPHFKIVAHKDQYFDHKFPHIVV